MRKRFIFLVSILFAIFAPITLYGESEIIFSYDGPISVTQDFSAKLYWKGRLLDTIPPGKTVLKTVPNDSHIFDARIGTSSKQLLVNEPNKKVYVNIVAKMTLSGIDINISIIKTEPLSPPTITITYMDFANADEDRNIISYGTSFETTYTRYIIPRITYNNIGTSSGNKDLNIKIINPDGILYRTSSSPRGYTYNTTLNVQAVRGGEQILLSYRGNDRGNIYSAGTYICEIWSNGQMLSSAKFAVTPVAQPFTITDIDFANTDAYLNVIGYCGSLFEVADIRYIVPRITYNNIGSFSGKKVLNIKIFNPDGSLKTYEFSPRGYSLDYTLNVQSGRRYERVLLNGLGNDRIGTYSAGTYVCEIWSDGQMLHSAEFTVTNDHLLNTIGVSVGTSFATPGLICTIHGKIAPVSNIYLEPGLDIGLIYGGPNNSEYYYVDGYYSLYPFINVGYFMPFTDEGGWYFGIGAGYMFAKYTFDDGTTDVHRLALNLTTGFNVLNIIDISYTLRTNFVGANNKLSVGLVYRFY